MLEDNDYQDSEVAERSRDQVLKQVSQPQLQSSKKTELSEPVARLNQSLKRAAPGGQNGEGDHS